MKHSKYLYGPGRAEYESEFTRFMNGYLHDHPDVVRDQELGWRIWWERPTTGKAHEQAWQEDLLARLPYHSYYYE
jgi:hypothetical protein